MEDEKIGVLSVKDMSWPGCNCLYVVFTGVFFLEKSVQFITINNGMDSA